MAQLFLHPNISVLVVFDFTGAFLLILIDSMFRHDFDLAMNEGRNGQENNAPIANFITGVLPRK